MPVAWRLPPATAIGARRRPFALELVAQPAQRLAPAALRCRGAARKRLQQRDRAGSRARSRRRPGLWSATRRPRSAPRPWSWECGWRARHGRARPACAGGCSSAIAVSIQTLRRAGPVRKRAPAPTPVDSIRVRWKPCWKRSVNDGRSARSAIAAKARSRGASISISALTGPSGRRFYARGTTTAWRAAARFAAHPESGKSLRQNPDARALIRELGSIITTLGKE